jgi:hypothetical protein
MRGTQRRGQSRTFFYAAAASIAAATKAALGDGALPISINDNHHLHHFVVRLPSRSLNGGAAFAAAPAY